jgi:hypothetical protein
LPPSSHLPYLPFATAAQERAASAKVVAKQQVADAVGGYFERKQRPKRIRLHFPQDLILAVA